MDKVRRNLIAGSGLTAAMSYFLAPSDAKAGIGRHFRRRHSECCCGCVDDNSGLDATFERGLDFSAGRPGKENPGQKEIVLTDKRLPGNRAYSLHLGVNWVDPMHYGNTFDLFGCLYDAQRMRQVADAYGFVSSFASNKYATTDQVLGYLDEMAKILVDGDILLITASSHGSNITDTNRDEDDHLDETWCLHDRMLIDDELAYAFSKFKSGVRLLCFLDACHSGTAIKSMSRAIGLRDKGQHSYRGTFGGNEKALDNAMSYLKGTEPVPEVNATGLTYESLQLNRYHRIRTLRQAEAAEIYLRNEGLYEAIQTRLADSISAIAPGKTSVPQRASVLLVAACQDGQVAQEVQGAGLFTSSVCSVLRPLIQRGELFDGDYERFLMAIKERMNGDTRQSPQLTDGGDFKTQFRNQRPFDISQRHAPTYV